LPRAADAYEIALGLEGLGPDMVASARDRLAVLKRQLGYVVIDSPIGATVNVAHVTNAPIPAKIHVQPGVHVVTVREPDGAAHRERVEVLAGSTASVKIVSRRAPSTASPAPVRAEPSVVPEGASTRQTFGWIALGTGAALGITAGVLGIKTLSDLEDCKDTRNVSDCDRARSSRLWTNVAAGAALVSGGVGLYLLLSADDGAEGVSARVELGPGSVRAKVSF
jgi:hypothetical protein